MDKQEMIAAMVRGGVSPAEAIAAVTQNASRAIIAHRRGLGGNKKKSPRMRPQSLNPNVKRTKPPTRVKGQKLSPEAIAKLRAKYPPK